MTWQKRSPRSGFSWRRAFFGFEFQKARERDASNVVIASVSEAIHAATCTARVDCFVAFAPRNDAGTHLRHLAARTAPELCRRVSLKEQRAQGMPGAWCARSRAWCVESTRVSHHGHTGNTRHSPRNGFNGFLRDLPGDRAFLPPSPPRSLLLENLTPASGRQDHTTSPSALAPLVRAKCLRCVAKTSTASRAQRP
jgi:hypothetical protein